MVEENELVKKYSDLLPIFASDYFLAKNSYDEYIRILDRLLNANKTSVLEEIKSDIKKNNPWKDNSLKSEDDFKSVAKVDKPILIPILEKEIEAHKQHKKEEDVEIIIKNRFKDFEHIFDGNFEDPRVLILGINPKMNTFDHEPYNLKNVYDEPFDRCRPILNSINHEPDDYYFSQSNGIFFRGMIKNKEDIYNRVLEKINSENEYTPVALWEFFPYASKSESQWYANVEIGIGGKEIRQYLMLRRILPSQIWLLCLLTYTIKKAILENQKLTIFLKKNNKEFRESFLDQYFSYINLQEIENIHLLTKKNGLRKEFSFTNVKPYYKNSTWKDIDNTEMFFSEVWGLEVKE